MLTIIDVVLLSMTSFWNYLYFCIVLYFFTLKLTEKKNYQCKYACKVVWLVDWSISILQSRGSNGGTFILDESIQFNSMVIHFCSGGFSANKKNIPNHAVKWSTKKLQNNRSEEKAKRPNSNPLIRSWMDSKLSGWCLTSSPVNSFFIRRHQAEIIIVKRLIQGRNNATRVRVQPKIMQSGSSKKWNLTSFWI